VAIKVANDLNELLTVIISNISLALGLPGDHDKVQQSLAEAEKAALRARDLLYQIATLARCGAPVSKRSDVAEIIQKSAGLCFGEDSPVRCEATLPDGLWPVQADPEQIGQVMQFLLSSLDRGLHYGELRIGAENMVLTKGNGMPLRSGNYVRISLEQQGAGSRPEVAAHLRDPARANEPDGRGMCFSAIYLLIRNILQQHGGHLTEESAAGGSVGYRLFLPAAKKVSGEPQKSSAQQAGVKGRILVMDDEEMIRNNVGMILNLLGYEAELAMDGSQALEMYERAQSLGAPFDAVIIDLTVRGGMGGEETFQKLLEMDPETKGILFSGHAEDVISDCFQNLGFRGVIKKPYEIKDFRDVLNRVLN
jgi:CheY-like chemotaxis protein